jgi:hypothetical protein
MDHKKFCKKLAPPAFYKISWVLRKRKALYLALVYFALVYFALILELILAKKILHICTIAVIL